MSKLKVYRALMVAGTGAAMTLLAATQTAHAGTSNDPADINEAAASSPGPLQNLGGEYLERAGIKVRGYIAGAYTFSFARPDSGFMGYGNLFDDKSDDPTLSQ